MSELQIDATSGDLAVVGNRLVIIMGADEVTQRLRSRLRMIRGEWWLNPDKGVPYREVVWIKGLSPTQVAAAFKREILTTPGVLELQAFDLSLDTALRKLTVTFTVKATDGDVVNLSEVLG